jgi:hypothetical protein
LLAINRDVIFERQVVPDDQIGTLGLELVIKVALALLQACRQL